MKSKRKNLLALSLAAVGAIGAFASVSAESIQGNFPSKVRDEVRTAIKQAFTSGDYQGYLLTTKEYKVGVPVLTEAQFNTMVQANKLRTQGDVAGAKKLLDEAGIKPQEMGNKGKGGEAMKTFIATLTDAQKAVMEQARTLMESGKKTEADALLKNAGIILPERGEGKGKGSEAMKAYMTTLTDAQKTVMEQAHTLMENGKKTEADALLKNAGITLPLHKGNMKSTVTQ